MRFGAISTRTEVLWYSLIWRHGVGMGLCWSLGEGTNVLILRQVCLSGTLPPECRFVGLVNMLGSQCQQCTDSYSWLLFMLRAIRGKKPKSAILFLERHLHESCLSVTLSKKGKYSPHCVLQTFFRLLFQAFSTRVFISLPSLQDQCREF